MSSNINNTKKEFIDFLVEVKRVTKVTKGGKKFRFAAFVVSGNGSGQVGIGIGKGKDVSVAVSKATLKARKTLFHISIKDQTITYDVKGFHGSSCVYLHPAYKGTGLIAGGAVRFVLKAAGINDIVAKSIGSSRSGINLVKATLNALSKCRKIEDLAILRGKTKKEILMGVQNNA